MSEHPLFDGHAELEHDTLDFVVRRYRVVLLNDHYTTFDFVIDILQSIFSKTHREAALLASQIHEKGRGVAGIYVREIAEAKVAQVHKLARAEGFPLQAIIE